MQPVSNISALLVQTVKLIDLTEELEHLFRIPERVAVDVESETRVYRQVAGRCRQKERNPNMIELTESLNLPFKSHSARGMTSLGEAS